MITPEWIYRNWPDNDLLGIGPPYPNETPQAYLQRAKQDAGDTLFVFVLAECASESLDDPSSHEEVIVRLKRAATDLEDLWKAWSSRSDGTS
jgi:hypothetical protein